jgi:hypothetical protein
MVLDPDLGLFIGMRGQGFMPGQYLAKMYVDKMMGNPFPACFDRLTLKGEGSWKKRLSKTYPYRGFSQIFVCLNPKMRILELL